MERTTELSSIKEAREASNMTREQLAKKLKISPPYVAGIEGGSLAHRISPRVEKRIREILGDKSLITEVVFAHNDKVRKYTKKHQTKASKVVSVKKRTKSASKIAKKAPQATSVQGLLPGFVEQLNNARIEEMVVDRLFQRLSERIDAKLDELFGVANNG
jgi:DNA-binding XRE family transcriptional regulator